MLASAFRLPRPTIPATVVLLGLAIIEIGCSTADLQFLAPGIGGR